MEALLHFLIFGELLQPALSFDAYFCDRSCIMKSRKMFKGRYLGLELPAGRHDVRLHYTTPYLHAGAALSAFGLLLTALTVLLTERARRRKQKLCKRKT